MATKNPKFVQIAVSSGKIDEDIEVDALYALDENGDVWQQFIDYDHPDSGDWHKLPTEKAD